MAVRTRIEVTGIVQGVGFRPHVARLASAGGLAGWCRNGGDGVLIEVEGSQARVLAFRERLVQQAPNAARIDQLSAAEVPATGDSGFRIEASQVSPGAAVIAPDLASCENCRAELFDVSNRRCGHPLISCTNCGPRYTITDALPFDRQRTRLADFAPCPRCAEEYGDPTDRRYHAQTVSCPECGPRLWFNEGYGRSGDDDEVVHLTASDLADGRVVGVKGMGGYHAMCDARDVNAIARLRNAKRRPSKPFAVLVADLDAARKIGKIPAQAAAALADTSRPIVIVKSREGLPDIVAPGRTTVGVMLASTGLQLLLLESSGLDALVCTSANVSGSPLIADDEEAEAMIGTIVDSLCGHDLSIAVPCDDSVLRAVDGDLLPIRLGRGLTPSTIELPFAVAPSLGAGGDQKNTACLASGRTAVLSQHLGDMADPVSQQRWRNTTAAMIKRAGAAAVSVGVDQHPGYHTRQLIDFSESTRTRDVQHHHAHLASLMAEHSLGPDEQILAFVFDGTGYGTDGTIWGGEVLTGGYRGFFRSAHLAPVVLPGGDLAISEPWRAALAHGIGARLSPDELGLAASPEAVSVACHQVETGLNSTATTSMGRLFDAVSVLLGGPVVIDHEAQAAIWLEERADAFDGSVEPLRFAVNGGVIDPMNLVRELVVRRARGEAPEALAAAFHTAVANMIVEVATELPNVGEGRIIGLTGGVFQNAVLHRGAVAALLHHGFTPLTHSRVPANDGGLALGQAAIAGMCEQKGSEQCASDYPV